jgi:hypothetical protein
MCPMKFSVLGGEAVVKWIASENSINAEKARTILACDKDECAWWVHVKGWCCLKNISISLAEAVNELKEISGKISESTQY